MHVIIVRWRIKPEFVVTFQNAIREHVIATRRSEPGCVQFDVSVDKQEPRTYHLFEIYADDRALEEHAKSPTLAKLREKIPLWVEDRTLYNATLMPRPGF